MYHFNLLMCELRPRAIALLCPWLGILLPYLAAKRRLPVPSLDRKFGDWQGHGADFLALYSPPLLLLHWPMFIASAVTWRMHGSLRSDQTASLPAGGDALTVEACINTELTTLLPADDH